MKKAALAAFFISMTPIVYNKIMALQENITLHEIEELIKSTTSKAAKLAIFNHTKTIADPNSTQAQQDHARDSILAIYGKGPLATHQESRENVQSGNKKIDNLKSAMEGVKPALANKMNEKISGILKDKSNKQIKSEKAQKEEAAELRAKIKNHERLNGRGPGHSHGLNPFEFEKLHPNAKQYIVDNEPPHKKAEREEWNHWNQVLIGTDPVNDNYNEDAKSDKDIKNVQPRRGNFTRKELETQTKRVEGVQKPKEIKYRNTTPAQKVASAKAETKSTIDGALNLVHDAHTYGLHDKANQILSNIPNEHMPSNMKGYLPSFIHYDVTPNHWAALSPEHREQMQNLHMDVMSGKHDNNPDPAVQKIVSKVKPPSS